MSKAKATKVLVLGCPWCGCPPKVTPWHGGGPRKTMVLCDSDVCAVQPSVAGNTANDAKDKWNNRWAGTWYTVAKEAWQ